MARVFDITTSADRTSTMAGSVAKLVYTVTNVTTRPLRGSLRAKALAAGQESWLSVTGDNEREFGPRQTHQVEVIAAPPAGTAACVIQVRLDAWSVANPDDDFTEGPVFGITVTAAPLPSPKKSLWWLWVVIGVVAIVLIGLVTWLAMRKHGDDVENRPPVVQAPATETNINRPGGDFSHFDVADGQVSACQAACDQNSRCQTWTFVRPGVQGPAAQCWLKDSSPPAVASDCCTTGHRALAR